jgi:hypothetical protein
MANIVDTALQPIETLASSGKNYGDGTADANSNRLPALTTSGYNEVRNAGGDITLPRLSVTFSMIEGNSGSGDVLLPSLTIAGNTGGQADLDLPSLTGTGSGTVLNQGLGAATLPQITIAASGTAGTNGRAALKLPRLTASGHDGGRAALVLPRLVATASGTRLESGSAALTLPLLRASGNASVEGYSAVAALVLPALVAGPYGSGALTLPLITVAGYDAGSIASGVGTGAFEGWAMNLRNGQVTRIVNWPFIDIVKWGDKLLGVAADGLYLIGGDTDGAAPIAWEWRTGLDDLGQPGVKRVPVVYVDGIIDGEVFVITKDDRGDIRKYRYEAERGRLHMPHRRELGKGVRTRNLAFGMSNGPGGAYMELDGLEPEATITQRSI